MIAVVVVRDGALPLGAGEAAAEAGGRVLLVGSQLDAAVAELARAATEVTCVEVPTIAPAALAAAVAPLVADDAVVVLPASPDGRDLAPRLAALLDRPLLAGAVEVTERSVALARHGGRVLETHAITGACVATLQPGVRGVDSAVGSPTVRHLEPAPIACPIADAEVVEVLPPDVTTMDLAEAPRIVGGGAGLDSAERFEQLSRVATALDASMGVTRVVTDRGWVAHERQIGTTGVVVAPKLYVNFAISGAVQHTSGLGNPEHVVSVNLDPHCPMMAMAQLAVVADANEVLDELAMLLEEKRRGSESGWG